MAALTHDCPHCGTRSAYFAVLCEYRHPRSRNEIHCYLRCQLCNSGAAAIFHVVGRNVRQDALTFENYYNTHPDEFVEIAFFPKVGEPEAPDHLPDNVHAYFLEAAANVKSGPNAAGAMFRKSIDVALSQVAPEAKGTLYARIDQAAEQDKITNDIAEWAHQVRLEGNDAAHSEDPFTPEEALQLHKFTELLLMYLFTLPGMLAERRAANDQPE